MWHSLGGVRRIERDCKKACGLCVRFSSSAFAGDSEDYGRLGSRKSFTPSSAILRLLSQDERRMLGQNDKDW